MREKARDFWTSTGVFISSLPIIMLVSNMLVADAGLFSEDYWYCSGASLLVGIPMLIIGLRMQAKYYGDNRMVKWYFWLGPLACCWVFC